MTFPSFSAGEVLRAQDMNAVGMWHLGTYTLSSTATQINSIFTSDYDNYRLVFSNVSISSADTMTLRLVAGTTPNTSFTYNATRFNVTSGAAFSGQVYAGANYWFFNTVGSPGVASSGTVEIYNPKSTAITNFNAVGSDPRAGGDWIRQSAGFFNATTSFDGIWISSLNGGLTLSGNVSVYGYRK